MGSGRAESEVSAAFKREINTLKEKNENILLRMVNNAIASVRDDPFDHDGKQPGPDFEFDDQGDFTHRRKKVGGTPYRLIYTIHQGGDLVFFRKLHKIPLM